MKFIKKNLTIILLVVVSFLLFSFKVLSIPPGLEVDEESILYNSSLISTNLRDENDRFLPIFILTLNKTDWKQPVLIYFIAFLFKIFGFSLFLYKTANIIISILSATFLYYISLNIFKSKKYAISAFLIYVTTPIVFITTRIGNESIFPSLVAALWLFTLLLYQKKNKNIYIVLTSLIIGIGFYTFKGMRIISPVWSVITFIYIYFINWDKEKTILENIFSKQLLKKIFIYIFILIPFYLITPILELKYAGAVFDKQSISINSIYNFFYYWLSNLGLSFWFTTPDIGRIYTVSHFGAFSLFFLPFFIVGIISIINKNNLFRLILISFISTPILFGVAHSINYTHRLMAAIPFIVLIILSGIKKTILYFKTKKTKNIVTALISLFSFLSLIPFYKFYFKNYPILNSTTEAFGKYTYPSFKELSKLSLKYQLDPFVEEEIYLSEINEHKFYNIAYFNNNLQLYKLGDKLPDHTILLTRTDKLDGFRVEKTNLTNNLNILIKN